MADVLFIDDDESIRFLVREELTLEGHRVRVAADGAEGLAAVAEAVPDMVVLDIKMPGLDGVEVLRRLKAGHPALPVVLFTAYTDPEIEARALGADAYLVKSADPTLLIDLVRHLTGPAPIRRETPRSQGKPTSRSRNGSMP